MSAPGRFTVFWVFWGSEFRVGVRGRLAPYPLQIHPISHWATENPKALNPIALVSRGQDHFLTMHHPLDQTIATYASPFNPPKEFT